MADWDVVLLSGKVLFLLFFFLLDTSVKMFLCRQNKSRLMKTVVPTDPSTQQPSWKLTAD